MISTFRRILTAPARLWWRNSHKICRRLDRHICRSVPTCRTVTTKERVILDRQAKALLAKQWREGPGKVPTHEQMERNYEKHVKMVDEHRVRRPVEDTRI